MIRALFTERIGECYVMMARHSVLTCLTFARNTSGALFLYDDANSRQPPPE
jgi:hypothetical protein